MNRGFRNRNVLSVELNRDGLNAPWGLRLKGGKDVEGGTPLEITRVSQRDRLIGRRNSILQSAGDGSEVFGAICNDVN